MQKVSYKEHFDYSLVTAILPRQTSGHVIEQVMASGAANAMAINARGTLIKDKWYHSFLPSLSPEQEIVRFLVPNSETDHLMEQVVMLGKLKQFGAGSIYCHNCEELYCSNDFPLWKAGNYRFESVSFDIRFKKDLVAILYIAQKEQTEAITRAAIRAGSQGPTISYLEGIGLRDRLGILRITKKPEKELIMAVVDRYDFDAVFQAMADAGKVDQPGSGFLFQVPVTKGLTNLASIFHAEKHSASIQQMVKAIDDLQGSTHWRANRLLIHDKKVSDWQHGKNVIKNASLLGSICHRKDVEILLDTALQMGVPGSSLSYWRFIESKCEHTEAGKRINREFGFLSMILAPEKVAPLREAMQETSKEHKMRETCFLNYSIPLARTFRGKKI
ncbi:MAG: hypothetical protein AAF984_07610 [Verrucomicrobiota bacterium]